VTDGHDGLLAAVSEQFTATARQRCLLHKQRNVLNAIPRRERGDVQAELVGIWEQPTKEEALTCLAAENRQVRAALPRSGTKPGRGRRASFHVLCFSSDDASAHADDQRH
jgi:putative transposase